MSLIAYVRLARPDHWFKNVFMLPGAAVALAPAHRSVVDVLPSLLLGVASACSVASANYVVNEWLDAEFDRHHPLKKDRPAVTLDLKKSWVLAEYFALGAVGTALAALVSAPFLLTSLLFLVMGVLYNVRPFRTKERVYLDVLSESVNNAIRLALGWFAVTATIYPPSSLVLGYWMAGAFLMAIKRYAELRYLADRELAARYRRSFRFYTEETLLTSSFFYAMSSGLFLGIFLIKHRIEYLLSFPFLALLFAWYLKIGMRPNSVVQRPERLIHEREFMVYVVIVAAVMVLLTGVDIPGLKWFLKDPFHEPS